MRRKDREVTDESRIDGIIRRCSCCRLGFSDGGEVYIVPMNFGFVKRDGKRVFYFHSAKEGRKVELLKNGCDVGFGQDPDGDRLTVVTEKGVALSTHYTVALAVDQVLDGGDPYEAFEACQAAVNE